MSNSYTKTDDRGLLQRLGGAFKGILVGLLMFIAAFPLIFWNESRAISTHQALEEGQGAVVSVEADAIDPDNEGELIHVTGDVTVSDALSDPVFGVTESDVIRLRRTVEMYQWEESQRTERRTAADGSEERVTVYTYEETWSDRLIDSDRFEESGYTNPSSMPYDSETIDQSEATLEAFTLSSRYVEMFDDFTSRSVSSDDLDQVEASGFQVHEGQFYTSNTPTNPEIGDVRVRFDYVPAQSATVVAAQSNSGFSPYITSNNNELEFVRTGSVSADAIFSEAIASNRELTWGLRGLALVLMIGGISLVFKPLAVVADVVPFLGRLARSGISFISIVIALPLYLIAIALAWLAARPLLGGALLVGALALMVGGYMMMQNRSEEEPQPSPA